MCVAVKEFARKRGTSRLNNDVGRRTAGKSVGTQKYLWGNFQSAYRAAERTVRGNASDFFFVIWDRIRRLICGGFDAGNVSVTVKCELNDIGSCDRNYDEKHQKGRDEYTQYLFHKFVLSEMRNKHDSRAESFIDINVAYFCRYVKHKYVNNCRKGKNKSTCESSLSVCLPAFLPISRVDIAQHTSAYTHNCISYSNTPNTGCPVLGVHIGFSRLLVFAKQISQMHRERQRLLRKECISG